MGCVLKARRFQNPSLVMGSAIAVAKGLHGSLQWTIPIGDTDSMQQLIIEVMQSQDEYLDG